jgi:hypothetical protein
MLGHAIAQAVSRRLPTAEARVRSQVRLCGICGGQSGTGADFGFSCQFPFHQMLQLSSEAGTKGQLVADVQSGFSVSPTKIKKENGITFRQSDRS